MTGGQYFGFCYYPAGISPAELRLGNIVWDYKQPVHKHSYQHKDDISTRQDLFDRRSYTPFDVDFTNPKTFTAGGGIENVAFLGAHFGNKVFTSIKSEKAESVYVLSTKLDDFEKLTCRDQNAREWLHQNLSAAFTVASYIKRLFRRPKLWLCTGLMTIQHGSYEVQYEGGKGMKLNVADPTGTVPGGAQLEVDQSPTSNRKLGINQSIIVGAQWMLLYCRNIKSTDDPLSTDYVELTEKYAKANVKGAKTRFVWISTDGEEIRKAEAQKYKLFVDPMDDEQHFSGEETGQNVDENRRKLSEPMFPAPGSEEYEKFEHYLAKLSKDEE